MDTDDADGADLRGSILLSKIIASNPCKFVSSASSEFHYAI